MPWLERGEPPLELDESSRRPLLSGDGCRCSSPVDEAADQPSAAGRARQACSCGRMLRRGEVSGALGDLGTFLPDVVALSNNPLGAFPSASFVFFSGLWSIAAGAAYDIPMPIQPMHTIVAVSLTEGLTYGQTVASGVWLGLAFLVLGASGTVGALTRLVPLPVVRGLQLGLGLKVMGTGLGMATRSSAWVDLDANLDGRVLGAVAAVVAVACYASRRPLPSSLFLFALGCVGVGWARPSLAIGLHVPIAAPPPLSADDWWQGLYRAALPQLPVTLLNAVVSTAKLSEDLYPSKPASVRKISLSIAAMNLSSAWLGHFPSCHGCGGLAAQHLFGARTGSSMVLMGLVKMGLAVAFGPSLLRALEVFPTSVLGVLLALSGVELAVCCRDMDSKPDFALMLVGAGCVLKLGTGVAFCVAVATAAAFRAVGGREPGEAAGAPCHA